MRSWDSGNRCILIAHGSATASKFLRCSLKTKISSETTTSCARSRTLLQPYSQKFFEDADGCQRASFTQKLEPQRWAFAGSSRCLKKFVKLTREEAILGISSTSNRKCFVSCSRF